MLTGTGFSNDPLLAHAQGQQSLTEGIVNFVRTRVIEIFTLQPDAWTTIRTAVMSGQTLSFVERGGSPHIRFQQAVELSGEG
jgi:hypothetical protein